MITETKSATTLPYKREPIDIEDLTDFAPDEPEPLPDAMLQNRIISRQILNVLDDHLSDFGEKSDVFVDSNAILCYDRSNLNVRIQPDFYAAFGVDAQAILDRELYLPWEVGKPPDFALEVASKTTARHDVTAKIEIYRRIGVPELWHFDHTGGDFYGQPLAGRRLSGGEYHPIETTARSPRFISGFSPATKLFICWDGGQLRFFDPVKGRYLRKADEAYRDSRELDSERAAHERTREAHERERIEHDETRQALMRSRERTRQLEEELRRLQGAK